MQQTCFFVGNRDAPQELREELSKAVEEVIDRYQVELFVTGGRGRFDRMAAETVQQLRGKYPRIRLCLLLAYHPAERPASLPPGYDESFYPLEKAVPARYAIMRVNRWMLAHCPVCIAGALLPGNARRMLEYARRRAQRGEMILIELTGQGARHPEQENGPAPSSVVSGNGAPPTCCC